MKTKLENWQKPLANEKVCSKKLVCGGKPQPNTREYFYINQSICRACMREVSRLKHANKVTNDLFFGN